MSAYWYSYLQVCTNTRAHVCLCVCVCVCAHITGCLGNGFHQDRVAHAQLHAQVGGAQLIQTQVHAAQQVIWNNSSQILKYAK